MMIFVNVCWTWSMVELKTRFETWITRSDVRCERFSHLSYLITLMVYLCSQWTPNFQINYFMFEWWIYSLFVLNRSWKGDCFEIMVFVCLFDMKHRWTINAFWDVSNKKWRKWCKFVTPSLFNNNYGLPVLTMDSKCPKHIFYVWLVDLQIICVK
jgi:hypothetical protein